jgi:hypothetical protein
LRGLIGGGHGKRLRRRRAGKRFAGAEPLRAKRGAPGYSHPTHKFSSVDFHGVDCPASPQASKWFWARQGAGLGNSLRMRVVLSDYGQPPRQLIESAANGVKNRQKIQELFVP